jgi:hypothetical protein
MREYFDTVDGADFDPLFCNYDDAREPLLRDTYIKRMRDLLRACGINAEDFAGHSTRRGAATTAASLGVTAIDIQRMGRWRSDAFKVYIDTPLDCVLRDSSRLHMAASLDSDPAPPELLEPWLA